MKTDSVLTAATHDVACVLYSPETGKIAFTHRFTVLGDAPHPSSAELERAARSALEGHRKQFDMIPSKGEKLEALLVPGEQFLPGHTFSVDPKSRAIVARPRPTPAAL